MKTPTRRLRRLALIALLSFALAGCAGLPVSGGVNPGLAIGEEGEVADPTPIAQGPVPGADPEDIVGGFLEASVTPAGNWSIAHEFLTDEFSRRWRPDAAVAIDSSVASRQFTTDVDPTDEKAIEAVVTVELRQIASVDETGSYSEFAGSARPVFRLERELDGEWRIAEAPDGIVLDAGSLEQVFRRYSLQYYDQSWNHLVPDVRWFPRRGSVATSITRALISGAPSPWLAPAVRSAFAGDIALAGDAVPVDSAQVASVSLNSAALSASPTALARMRTQLEASLAGLGVSEVRFSVDGVSLEAGRDTVEQPVVDPGVLVLNAETFGAAIGDEITALPGLSAEIAKMSAPIATVDVALDRTSAAVQLGSGAVYAVRDGATELLDQRAGLIAPSVDPFGFTWTVPRDQPAAVQAWDRQIEPHPVAQAWPDAASISHVRVSSDGARVAAVIVSGGQRRLVVAAVLRGEAGVPEQLGDVLEVTMLSGAAHGLAWVGSDTLAVLVGAEAPTLLLHPVGGPAVSLPAPAGATSLSGGRSAAAIRVLSSDGVVSAQRGSSWQESVSGILVLGTRAGF